MTLTDHHKHFLLIGAGAIAILIYLLRQSGASSPGSNGSLISDEAISPAPAYPQNPTPAAGSDIEIGGSPVNMTYNYGNPLPTLAVGGNTGGECGCDSFCDQAGQKVTLQNVPQDMLTAAAANFSGWTDKLQTPASSPRTSVPSGAAIVQPNLGVAV